jgi:hypothetical protein
MHNKTNLKSLRELYFTFLNPKYCSEKIVLILDNFSLYQTQRINQISSHIYLVISINKRIQLQNTYIRIKS